jgi:hypothetical protein
MPEPDLQTNLRQEVAATVTRGRKNGDTLVGRRAEPVRSGETVVTEW